MVLHDALHAVAQLCCGTAAFGVAEKVEARKGAIFRRKRDHCVVCGLSRTDCVRFSPLRMTCRRSP